MSDGSEFHRSDEATGKERRPTVVSRKGGTSSCCDCCDDEILSINKLTCILYEADERSNKRRRLIVYATACM